MWIDNNQTTNGVGNAILSPYFCGVIKAYVREWREYLGWTQEELAEKSKVVQGTISRIERTGTGSVRSIQKIAGAMAVANEALRNLPPIPKADWPPPRIQLDDLLKGTITIEGIELTEDMKKELARYARLLKMEAERGH